MRLALKRFAILDNAKNKIYMTHLVGGDGRWQ